MKVSFTIAQRGNGSYEVLYAGADVGKALEAHNKVCEKPEGFLAVATFRKPVPIKRRKFENAEANERWAKAIEEKAAKDLADHKLAKVKAAEKAKADKETKGAAAAKAQSEAEARRKEEEAERIAEQRRLEVELQSRAAARAAARNRELGLTPETTDGTDGTGDGTDGKKKRKGPDEAKQ